MQNSSMLKAKITSRRPWLLSIGGILSLAAIALGVRYGKPQGKDLAKTLKVERKNIVQSLQLSGKVTPEKTMVITAQQSGRIVSLNAKEGIKVESGDLLFTMQLEASGQTELMEMRAHVKSLEQEVASSSQLVKNKNSVKELIGFDQVAREESNLEKLKIELNSARERLNIVEANLGLSHVGASKLKNSADRSGLVYVRSPIQGIVTLVDKRPGDFVLGGVGSAGSGSSEFGGNNERMVMVVADMSKLQVRIKVMESDLRFIKLGLPVKVRLDAYPEMSYEGQVEQIGGQGRTEVKAGYTYFDVIVAINQRDDRLLPEMNASVDLIFAQQDNTLTLPVSGVLILPGKSLVRIKSSKDPRSFEYRAVQTGVVNATDIEILSGLNEGDEVLEIDFSSPQIFDVAETSNPAKKDTVAK